MRFPKIVFVFVCIVWLAGSQTAEAQTAGRIVTKTRLVAVFSDLQNEWFDAVKKKDSAALNRLLGEDYQVWSPAHNGPIPREDYQEEAFARELKSYRIENMAVRAVREDVSVESFLVRQVWASHGAQSTETLFVVNVWTSEGSSWRCTDSYVTPVTGKDVGQGPPKPTGKE